MTAEDLLDAYRDEMAPTLGLVFIEGFIARNRSTLLRMLAPLVARMNARMRPRVQEDPDEVTPEKDAIVWAAFEDLVEQKKRELGVHRGPDPKPQRKPRARAERKPEAIDAASLKSAIVNDSLSEGQRSALRDIILQQPEAALRVAAIGGNEASIPNAKSVADSLKHLGLGIDTGDLRHAWMVAMQAIEPMVAKTNAINQTDEVPRQVLEKIGFDNYTREGWRRLFMGAFDSAIERLYPGARPSLDLEAALWSRVFAREVALAALGVKPSLEELLPTGSGELASGIKKWLASTGEVVESLRSCRSCRPSSRKIREEERGRNAVHDANIMDAGLTAAWRGMTESMPFFGRRKPDRKEIVEYIQEIKETRKSDWRLAERLATYFEVSEAKVVEWLNEFNVCPGATVRTMASKCDPSRYKAPKKADGWLSRTLSGRPKREVIVRAIREMKRERRSDWHLAPSLGGHFGVPDETIVEWLRHYDICPGATTRSMASQCVIEDVESMPSGTRPIGITLRHPERQDLVAMVTASASEPGRYQLTWADNDGPSGHTTRDTPEEAVRYAVDEGYRLDTANSAEAREMVERVQQERERRAAEIESWLTESLPSRKTSSPQTAQQFIAAFMRWKPHDRMYYELLELRPEATAQEIEAKWGRSLKLTDTLNPRRPMYRDSSVTRQAYDVLTNPGWRRDYDANGNLDASFQGLRQRALDATLTVASGDAMTDEDREVLLGVAEMGPEAFALHRNLRLPEVVAKTREILHEMDADDAKYRLPHRTESLPAPKHAGRMGDGFKVGEHVIRIGDMIKMEGQLGGYVENVDRVKGIARIEQDNGEIKTWPLASLLHDTKTNRERQQEHNDQINAEAEARLERSLADWRAR